MITLIGQIHKKEKLIGYIDGFRFLSRKKKLYGTIEKLVNEDYIDKNWKGRIGARLKNNGEIFYQEEYLGYLKDKTIFFPDGTEYVKYFEEENEIRRLNRNEKWKIESIKLEGNEEPLDKGIFYGIAVFYIEIFK